jgi:HTH-type transcriptional regulator, transcriptional repressor of NAD biosynthesis genes
MSTRGLVLGKFAPLHRGHQLLIERSLATCDETAVLVYEAGDVTSIPTSCRAQWIRDLYPTVEVIEGHGAPQESGRSPRIQAIQEAYLCALFGERITHVFSSEWYGEHVSRALGASDERVDERRSRFPISGTALRLDPARHRAFVAPRVWFDLIGKVVLLGAESTGKSTLAAALAQRFDTVAVAELGRDFWNQHHDASGRLSLPQLEELARLHRASELRVANEANRLVFIDTDARITRQYARFYHGVSTSPLDHYAEECGRRYDFTVLCADDFPYVEDGTRAGASRRRRAQDKLRRELAASRAPWIEVFGSVEARVEQVAAAIEKRRLDRYKV